MDKSEEGLIEKLVNDRDYPVFRDHFLRQFKGYNDFEYYKMHFDILCVHEIELFFPLVNSFKLYKFNNNTDLILH